MMSVSAINPVAMENTGNKHDTQPQGSHIYALQINSFALSVKRTETQKSTCKFMMCGLYVLRYAYQAEATSSSEKIMPLALAIIKLQLSEGIREAVSQ